MASSKLNSIRSTCYSCQKDTFHNVKYEHFIRNLEDYQCEEYYMVVECRGCGKIAFRYLFRDFESSYPIDEENWEIPERVEVYPKQLINHKKIENLCRVPSIVRDVYEDTLIAIKENAGILVGLGLRCTVEAVCIEQGISGKNLEKKISNLASQGLISQKDSELLHAIRFLGNDAAHDITKPSESQIFVALKIINHLITSVYILKAEAKGTLDTLISNFDEFIKILKTNIKEFKHGDEYPLARFLGKDVRRIHVALSILELELISKISSGSITFLSLGKVAQFGGNPSNLQHFILNK